MDDVVCNLRNPRPRHFSLQFLKTIVVGDMVKTYFLQVYCHPKIIEENNL